MSAVIVVLVATFMDALASRVHWITHRRDRESGRAPLVGSRDVVRIERMASSITLALPVFGLCRGLAHRAIPAISTGIERQQLKWISFSLDPGRPLGLGLTAGVPSVRRRCDLLHRTLLPSRPCPLATGVRRCSAHRLYDIDVVINRTLVYGTS